MGDTGSDIDNTVGLRDLIESIDSTDVDERFRLGQPEFQKRDQAMPSRQNLPVVLMRGYQFQCVLKRLRSVIVEFRWYHGSMLRSRHSE